MLGTPYLGACAGERVTVVQLLSGGLRTVHHCWAACGTPHHVDSQNTQNVGMGHGKMLVSDAELVDARRLMRGERDGFTAIAAGF